MHGGWAVVGWLSKILISLISAGMEMASRVFMVLAQVGDELDFKEKHRTNRFTLSVFYSIVHVCCEFCDANCEIIWKCGCLLFAAS